MKNSKSLLLAVLLVGFTSSAAMAEEGKVYAAIDAGQGNAPSACEGLPANFSCNTTTTAYRVGMGYQLSKDVGFEAAYFDGGKVNASGTISGVAVTAFATLTGFQLSAIGALPVTSNVAFLGKLGVASIQGKVSATATSGGAYATASGSHDNTNFVYGLGVRFAANDRIAIRVMYEDFGTVKVSNTDTGGKVTLLSAGLQVGF